MSNRYEHLHYCEYRDTETGLVASNYVEVMNEQDQKIKDLEAQLAEKEERIGKLNYEITMKNMDYYIEGAIAELEKVKEWLEPKYFDKEQIKSIEKNSLDYFGINISSNSFLFSI